MDLSLSELREFVMDMEAWRAAIHGVGKSRTQLSDWTELKILKDVSNYFISHQNDTLAGDGIVMVLFNEKHTVES